MAKRKVGDRFLCTPGACVGFDVGFGLPKAKQNWQADISLNAKDPQPTFCVVLIVVVILP